MGVHESASVYSEEKAKLVRAEVERVERADSEAQAALASMGVKEGVARYRVMLQDPDDDLDDDRERGGDVPREIHRMKSDISLIESQESTPALLSQLSTKRDTVRRDLDSIQRDLELESRECESMRVRYGHRWGQDPSASFTVEFRKELKTHLGSDEGGGTSGGSLAAAAASDRQVLELWEAVRGDIGLLLTSDDGQLEQMFSTNSNISTGGPQQSLLDLDEGNTEADALAEAKEKEIIAGMLSEVEGYLMGLKQIGREREGILRDLKDKVCGFHSQRGFLLGRNVFEFFFMRPFLSLQQILILPSSCRYSQTMCLISFCSTTNAPIPIRVRPIRFRTIICVAI